MKFSGKIFIAAQLIALMSLSAQQRLSLGNGGTVPFWLTNGPFEIETVGFGDLSDKAAIDEVHLKPEYLSGEINPSFAVGKTQWQFLSSGENGYTDLKEYYGWKSFKGVEKVWYQKIVYAFAKVYSPGNRQVQLRFGGNTVISISLNGEKVYSSLQPVNAKKDDFTQTVNLKQGENTLLLKIASSHNNHSLSFFEPLGYDWGFFLRLTGINNENLEDVSIIRDNSKIEYSLNIIPTYFYKKIDGKLKQKYLAEITSPGQNAADALISFKVDGNDYKIPFRDIKFGINKREFFISEPRKKTTAEVSFTLNNRGDASEYSFVFEPMPKYNLYYMPTTHMDIGYTNPQPVVIERQLKTLDDVIEKCSSDKQFKWTIETLWLLENYRESRSREEFLKLISLIKKGQVAVSPIYSNPFTGWISENELIESFRWAKEYKEKYGIEYLAAVYNDVPGQSWALPQVLKKAGVKLLVNGINEIFGNYKFQRNLPKVFNWVGSSEKDTVLLYLTEAYTEGIYYGLERDNNAIENRLWHRINNLIDRGYPFEKILVSGVFTDNAGIAYNQYSNAIKWNEEYEYPKFIISTINDFCKELEKEKLNRLKTIRGDWTSDWDILNQGETRRMLKYRWIQNNLPQAEILSSISSLENAKDNSFAGGISSAYKDILTFSGHGSGLEYGYGSKSENVLTDDFREGYVQSAYLKTRELLIRTAYRLTAPKESFDSHGVIVFNTLSWERAIPVEIDFPETDLNDYSIIDLSDKSRVSSVRLGDKLYFLASGVPGLAYKQYELTPAQKKSLEENKPDAYIDNEYYSLSLSEKGISIREKASGEDMLGDDKNIKSFMPLLKRFNKDEKFRQLEGGLKLTGVEKNEVFEELRAGYENDIFKQIKFRLWKKLNRIDISVLLNLSGQKETENTEEYGFPFLLNAPSNSKVLFETLGGLTAASDRFEATGHQYFAVRRVIDIPKENGSYLIASPSCRIFVSDTAGNKTLLVANILNNFPKSWNRNEDKNGTAEFKFSIAKANSKSLDAACFGYEASSDQVVRRSWYKKDEPVKQFIKLSNPIVKLVSLRPAADGGDLFELILQNTSPDKKQSVTISSDDLFAGAAVSEVNLIGGKLTAIPVEMGSIKLEMSPNSIKNIMVKKAIIKTNQKGERL